MKFRNSRWLQTQSHRLIPGGCHTYAKGDDQFPWLAPGFIQQGKGAHAWDVDGNRFIEYGIGCRAVTLGHAFEPVISAVMQELGRGVNFSRPSPLEVECAETLLSMVKTAEMCKFSKDGSDATSAAIKLSRAATGRSKVAICSDHPFFSIDDWFIGTTNINSGIPKEIINLTLGFRYNDPESLEDLFKNHPGQISCVILEPAKYSDPKDNFLGKVRALCDRYGALMILDEMITGFRWHNSGAQFVYGVTPDISTFGKALANGFSVSAILGKRKYLELGGLYHDKERVFLLSTTHGAETHSLAAAIATMKFYQEHPVIETLEERGFSLKSGID
ncbi:MAG: glutamate-1-semialdehyde 2,1-aminomutase, partial [Planctomycetota bacterium]